MGVAVHVHTPPDRLLVQKRAIATVPARNGLLECRGTRLNDFPLTHRALQQYLIAGAKRFIERMKVRGFEYVDFYDVHVYGPFPSYDLPRKLRDITEFNVDPERAKDLVEARKNIIEEYADYRLVANFVAIPTEFDEPVVLDPNQPGVRHG